LRTIQGLAAQDSELRKGYSHDKARVRNENGEVEKCQIRCPGQELPRKKTQISYDTKTVFLVIFMLFLFMGSSIGYVWSNFERTQIGYDLSQLKKEEMRLREINRKLRLDLAIQKSTKNLEAIATQKLGLRQPSPEQIIVLP